MIFAVVLVFLISYSEQCQQIAKPLDRLAQRGFMNTGGSNQGDENLVWDWYSAIYSGVQYLMSASQRPFYRNRCGVMNPICINGTHPDVNSITDVPIYVSVVHVLVSNLWNKLYHIYNIRIRKCNGEIQYYLGYPYYNNYSSGYCFDPAFPVNNWNCTSEELVIVSGIKTQLQFLREGNSSTQEDIIPNIVFCCNFTNIPGRFYTVSWFIDDISLVKYGPSNKTDDFLLHETTLLNFTGIGSLHGKKIKCSVSLSSTYDINKEACTSQSSAVPVGAELDSTTVYLSKSGTGRIKVKFNAPVGCGYSVINNEKPSLPCEYSLKLFMKNGWSCSTGGIVNLVTHPLMEKFCTEPMKMLESSSEWNGSSSEFILDIVTTDRNYDDNKDFTLQLMFDDSIVHEFWKNFTFPDIKVKVMTENIYKNKVCYSHIDPHMRSADTVYYEQHVTGTYMLYKNKQYHIEVQEQVKECYPGSRVRCACGIAIRAGKDVFMINLCGKINFMDFTQCGDGGILTVLQASSLEYRVSTPIGTRINIVRYTYSNILNIDLFMAPKDEGNVFGLCGKFDNSPTGDLLHSDGRTVSSPGNSYDGPLNFVSSWTVSDDVNLFLTPDRPLESWEDINKQFCLCQRPGTSFSEALCSSSQDLGCSAGRSITKKKCSVTNRKKRCSTTRHDEELRRLFALMNQEPRENRRFKRSVQSNITADEAAVLCSALNNSLSATDYADVSAGENISAVISQCIIDVAETGDASMVQVHIDAMNSLVRNIIELSPSYAANNTDKVEYFLANSCPANCSGKGICSTNGTCSCNDNYGGSDCSINISELLIIDDIEGGGACGIDDGNDCQCFTLRTDNLLEGFTCSVTVYEVSSSGSQKVLWTGNTSGEYQDTFTGVCCVYDKGTTSQTQFYSFKYEFALSNDGKNYGNAIATLIYNSACQDVKTVPDNSKYVFLQDGFCFTEETGIEETTARYNCSTCNPAQKLYDCSEVCKKDITEESNKMVVVIVVGVLLGLVVVIVVVACIIWKFCFQKKVTSNVKPFKQSLTGLSSESNVGSVSKTAWSLQIFKSKEFNQQEKNPFPVVNSFERAGTCQGPDWANATLPSSVEPVPSSADALPAVDRGTYGFFSQNLLLERQDTQGPIVDPQSERSTSRGVSVIELDLN